MSGVKNLCVFLERDHERRWRTDFVLWRSEAGEIGILPMSLPSTMKSSAGSRGTSDMWIAVSGAASANTDRSGRRAP
jgi:hypothetical protein